MGIQYVGSFLMSLHYRQHCNIFTVKIECSCDIFAVNIEWWRAQCARAASLFFPEDLKCLRLSFGNICAFIKNFFNLFWICHCPGLPLYRAKEMILQSWIGLVSVMPLTNIIGKQWLAYGFHFVDYWWFPMVKSCLVIIVMLAPFYR